MENIAKIKSEKCNKHIKLPAILFVFMIFGMLFASIHVEADGGLIPFHHFSVYEPGQKAIIAWDGAKEVMILSVDVFGTEETKALHMVPFPSLPEVELGNVSAFEKIEEIINSKWHKGGLSAGPDVPPYGNEGGRNVSVVIIFHERIGPHNITVVRINSPYEFTEWANNFLKSQGVEEIFLPDNLDEVVEHYTQQDVRYFAFDVIDIDPNKKTVDPIIYTFNTTYLYFPLKISSIIEGDTEISLAFITPRDLPINIAPMNDLGFYKWIDVLINKKELEEINPQIAELFQKDARLSFYKQHFHLMDLTEDVKLEKMNCVRWMHMADGYTSIIGINDVDFDKKSEIIIRSGGKVCALNAEDGSLLWDYRIYEEPQYFTNMIYGHLLDIDIDGKLELIILSSNGICVLNAVDGSLIWKKPDSYSTPILVEDLNSDGIFEVILASQKTLHVYDGEYGLQLWNFTCEDSRLDRQAIIIYDLNMDGIKDIFIRSYDMVFVFSGADGSELWRRDFGDGFYYSPIIDDLNLDGKPEIVIASREGREFKITVLCGEDGSELWQYKGKNGIIQLYDVNFDGEMEIIICPQNEIYILNAEDGSELCVLNIEDNYYIRPPPMDDIDGDNKAEFIICSYDHTFAINSEDGSKLWEFIKGNNRYQVHDIEDIDNDGKLEIITSSYNGIFVINGKDGLPLWSLELEYDSNPTIMLDDLDLDGKNDLIVRNSMKIHAVRSEDGIHFWDFTSGEWTRDFELYDLNSDGLKDILVITDNKMYAVSNPLTIEWEGSTSTEIEDPDKDSVQEVLYSIYLLPILTLISVFIGYIYILKKVHL